MLAYACVSWRMLAYTQVATKAYIKVRDMRMLDFINRIRMNADVC
jgi:hypothetical protein